MAMSWPPALIANRYHLLESLGTGSFGEVFKAEDLKFNPPRYIALKLLHPHLVNDHEVCSSLRSEASILALYNHPYILRVLDFEIGADVAYIVTELATGGSLESRLRTHSGQPPQALPFQQVATYLDQLGQGLDEIHARGQIHRDLKPANVLLGSNNQVLLADFGLALTLDRSKPGTSSRLMTAAVAWGTAEYAAPEIWDDKVGKASDIYALGVLLYQMLTGYTPFQGHAPALMKQHLQDTVPPLSKYAPNLVYPAAIDSVIARAMAKNPHERYRRASEFAQAFRAALNAPATSYVPNRPRYTPPSPYFPTSPQPAPKPAQVPLAANWPPPQAAAQPQASSHLDYLTGLFERSTAQRDWANTIEFGQLILKLDNTHQPTLTKTITAYRQQATELLQQRQYRLAFHSLMGAIKLETHVNPDHTSDNKNFLIAIYDLLCAGAGLLRLIQRPENRAKANVPLYDYDQAIYREPHRAEHYYERGRYLSGQGDYDGAIADFSRALQLERDHYLKTCYYRERGLAYTKKGNNRAARRDFREAAKYRRMATFF